MGSVNIGNHIVRPNARAQQDGADDDLDDICKLHERIDADDGQRCVAAAEKRDGQRDEPTQKEKAQPENPAAEKNAPFAPAAEKSPPSEPISESSSKSARGTSDGAEKPSVRQELRDIQAQRKKEAEAARAEEPAAPQKKAAQKTTRHQPPKPKKKPKSKER